jgi:hypothetical protein
VTSTVELPWELTAPQADIFHSSERYLVLVAGRRFGKTVLAIVWLLTELVRRGPGSLGYYVAPYRVMAKAIAWDLLVAATRDIRDGVPNIGELTIPLVGGRKVALKGADDPERLEGVGLSAVVLDEFARMKLDAWQKSIRPALSDKGGRALFCGKPRGHNHLKDFYERGQDRASYPDWRSWLYRTADGGFVPASDVAEAKQNLPARVFRQEYEATFESLAGRVYDEFSRQRGGKSWHVVPHADIERQYKQSGRWLFRRVVIGVDWGLVAPGVMLVLGLTSTGRIVVVHEEVHEGMLVSELGWLRIAGELKAEYRPERFVADPSEPGNIKALRLSRGSPLVENAHNEIAEGIRRVSVKLLDTGNGPGLVISDACHKTIREIEGYVWREVAGVAVEEPAGGNDHCMDAMRYATYALTSP